MARAGVGVKGWGWGWGGSLTDPDVELRERHESEAPPVLIGQPVDQVRGGVVVVHDDMEQRVAGGHLDGGAVLGALEGEVVDDGPVVSVDLLLLDDLLDRLQTHGDVLGMVVGEQR